MQLRIGGLRSAGAAPVGDPKARPTGRLLRSPCPLQALPRGSVVRRRVLPPADEHDDEGKEERMIPHPDERPVLSAEEAFKELGIDRATGYRAIRDGTFPIEVIRVGRAIFGERTGPANPGA